MATSNHARSNSLPSRQHPFSSQIDENLNQLRSSQSVSASSSSIGQKLNGLQDLHECLDMMLQLPLNQQALAQQEKRKWVEELLNGSLLILDVCSTAKDSLLQTKEYMQQLQSILRRRRGVDELVNEVRKYFTSRKAVKKAICKALKNLKYMENRQRTSSFNKDGENEHMIVTLKEIEAITLRVLESLLSFISGPETESKLSHWSLVSKLMHQKKVACEEEESNTNELANAEATLCSFLKSKNIKHIENVQNELQKSEMCIQDIEGGVERLYRNLIKARVTVLNFLNY